MEENSVMEEIVEETTKVEEKQHYYYAQLDENNLCVGVSDLSGEVEAANMILLETYDFTVMGKKYENGAWVEVEQPTAEETEPQPTNAEIKSLLLEVQEQNLVLMEALAEMYESSL